MFDYNYNLITTWHAVVVAWTSSCFDVTAAAEDCWRRQHPAAEHQRDHRLVEPSHTRHDRCYPCKTSATHWRSFLCSTTNKLLSSAPAHATIKTQQRCNVLVIVIVIVNSKFLKRHSKAKRRASAYSSNQRRFPKNSPWVAQVRFP